VSPPHALGRPAATAFAVDPRGRIATVTGETVTVWANGKSSRVLDGTKLAFLTAHDVGFLVFTLERTVITIDAANATRRFDLGEGAQSIAREVPRVAIVIDGHIALLDLRDGSLVQFPWLAQGAAISRDGRRIVTTSMGSTKATILTTQAPREPRDVLRWLDGVTNATLEPGSTEISWKR
jgi:hypothetical protein